MKYDTEYFVNFCKLWFKTCKKAVFKRKLFKASLKKLWYTDRIYFSISNCSKETLNVWQVAVNRYKLNSIKRSRWLFRDGSIIPNDARSCRAGCHAKDLWIRRLQRDQSKPREHGIFIGTAYGLGYNIRKGLDESFREPPTGSSKG